ncbi:MAG: hypothetical protein Q9169_006452 [Polycauliona sp. 2 TL-2023]
MSSNAGASPATTVLLFGPQSLSLQDHSFSHLRSAIRGNRDNNWMRTILDELPRHVELFSQKLKKQQPSSTQELLQSIGGWLDSDAPFPEPRKVPNTVLTPLVVLDQLAQYTQYVEVAHIDAGLGSDCWSPQLRRSETLGFCTGILSALVVSSASSKANFQTLGAVAVRLATLVGAVVDAEDGENANFVSFSTAWNTSEQEESLKRIVAENSSEAYISVYYDKTRATVTTSSRTSQILQQRLKEHGIVANEIALRGRYHCAAYRAWIDDLITLCDSLPELQLPDASKLVTSTFATSSGHMVTAGKLHHTALREILLEPCEWYRTFETTAISSLKDSDSLLVVFGQEKCVPPSTLRYINDKVVYMANQEDTLSRLATLSRPKETYSDDDIAVVGMASKVAGADDVEELWDLMCRAESQHIEVPESRFTFETQWRENDPKRKWYGNFIRDHDAFDHKFFKKSPREVTSQDPQQRLFLQSAYQAVEQSGYFNSPNPDSRVGVYVGVCAADYEANIACYQPNAFSATGNLKSFIAGKISHYFGWTGPGLTIDTACSASAVAVHQACRAILGGECTAALAGGTTVMTSPVWFQNLAGATFLSPTGACKPFDAKADGYCRGEAVASVFLKKMGQAVRDGDTIIGCIRSTAVYQNANCTPIFVPNAPSLASLFEDVIHKARMEPQDITLVEAHGTGTPVGDPAEYESILRVLGGRKIRSKPMPIGSIKGLIGHTECASGVLALIKVLLLLNRGEIPPQASYQTLSHAIKATADDMLEVNTKLVPWTATHRAALINNYGASGSNASMIVAQAPTIQEGSVSSVEHEHGKQAFWISGMDERSLQEYCTRLRQLLVSHASSTDNKRLLANLSYNLSRQSNRTLPKGLVIQCETVQELDGKLAGFIHGKSTEDVMTRKAPRPVILCFGGQIAQFVGLDKMVYHSHSLLRIHLDQCNSVLLSLGIDSIYPTIFEKTRITDTVKLQTSLFALQYSCAQCWIDCGVQAAAVVGHSFGELTALCVAGVLSLREALRMVAARAKLIREAWGSDAGLMMAVEGSQADVQVLLEKAALAHPAEPPASIACYNGPKSFTLAGSTKAVEALEDVAGTVPGLRSKKLAVANAFHSVLVEPLETGLAKIGQGMSFRKQSLWWERATQDSTSSEITPDFFATHMRQPVYANHAFQRLHQKHPSAIWLEAGSTSTITNMIGKALASPSTSYFQGVNISSSSGRQNLLDVTVNLWKEGLMVHHWAHHASQSSLYSLVLLPPYQFEKSRHWLELKRPEKHTEQTEPPPHAEPEPLPTTLYTFVGYQDKSQRHARFRVNTMIKQYEELVSGHVIAHTLPICPATVEMSITVEALLSLRPDLAAANMQPEIHNVSNQAPICIDASRAVWLDVRCVRDDFSTWDWDMTSSNSKGANITLHVNGQIILRSTTDPRSGAEFARYERLVGYQRCLDLLQCDDADETIVGRNMYKVFSEIVDYAPPYHGLQKLVGKGNTSAGHVVKKHSGQTWLDPHLSDCFSQVGGFWVNCMTDRAQSDMYIAAGFESWIRAPQPMEKLPDVERPSAWHVMATHHKISDKAYTSDIFIYDASNGSLCEVILGVHYARIPKTVMSKTLLRLTPANVTAETVAAPSVAAGDTAPPAVVASAPVAPIVPSGPPNPLVESTRDESVPISPPQTSTAQKQAGGSAILAQVAETLAELTGLEIDSMKLDTKLADVGIDSLMGMEMANELSDTFKCTLDMDRLSEATMIRDVTDCVAAALGVDSSDDGNAAGTPDSATTEGSRGSSQSPAEHGLLSSVTSVSDNDLVEAEIRHDQELQLPPSAVLEAFGESKLLTDQFITDYQCAGYMDTINPKQTQLCIALILEAFEELGCPMKTAKAGQQLERVPHAPQHSRLARYLYEVLEVDGRLINIDGTTITRTAVSAPTKSSREIVDSLVAAYPNHNCANRLASFCGSRLVDVLAGKLDGVKLIFGTDEGRELVSGLYGDSSLNKLSYKQMEDILKRLVSKLPPQSGPLKILEMGAGTGGTTKYLVPLLAEMKVPVEYTFTDLAPSFVAAARKKYKAYPFMKFCSHDIEKVPADNLIGTQHLIVASNAVHATRSLPESLTNIRKALRPDGLLMMLEMTQTLRWVDIIFGLLEGWWLFEDGRLHALSHQSHWEEALHNAGYGHVDWTDGHLPESQVQRLLIAMASGPQQPRLRVHSPPPPPSHEDVSDIAARRAAVDMYVEKYSAGFKSPAESPSGSQYPVVGHCVVITGATGSVGCHLVAHLAALPSVSTVVCLNRIQRGSEPVARQHQALLDRGIHIDPTDMAKLHVLQSDTSKPCLGLEKDEYTKLVGTVTHIIHNAWPMSGNRPIHRFEAQFQVMRNLIDLCHETRTSNPQRTITFQFISSIAVVGHQPLWSGTPIVPEEPVDIASVLPNGYGDAKYACERILTATLGQQPHGFRTMSVRLGQVAGNSKTGYWNTQEHLSFLVKSSQTLRALPDFEGQLSWTPVDFVAATLSDLVFQMEGSTAASSIYHIDNPVRQPWREMIKLWASKLDIPLRNIVPFEEWVRRVRRFPGSMEKDNPAGKLVDFLDGNFLRMSCGGLLLDTERARAHSVTLANVGPVGDDVAVGYLRYWQKVGFLSAV